MKTHCDKAANRFSLIFISTPSSMADKVVFLGTLEGGLLVAADGRLPVETEFRARTGVILEVPGLVA